MYHPYDESQLGVWRDCIETQRSMSNNRKLTVSTYVKRSTRTSSVIMAELCPVTSHYVL